MGSGVFTGISVEKYVNSGGEPHNLSDSKLVGYCSCVPEAVFEKLFLNFYITRFKGFELFSKHEHGSPMKGLSIYDVEPVFGIGGGVSGLLKLDEVRALRRDKSYFMDEVGEIIKTLNGEYEIGTSHNVTIATLRPDSNEAKEYQARERSRAKIIKMISSFG